MTRLLLMLGTAILLLNALVTPTVVRADGGGTTTNCNGKMCKP
jgi:hypothetical protein